MSIYRAKGRPFRGHPVGATFEADLDRNLEARAINRGSLELLERSTTRLVEGSYRLPTTQKERSNA